MFIQFILSGLFGWNSVKNYDIATYGKLSTAKEN